MFRLSVIRLLALCLCLLGSFSALAADVHAVGVQVQCLDLDQESSPSVDGDDNLADADDLVRPPRIKPPLTQARHVQPLALTADLADVHLPPRLRPPTQA